MAVAMQHTASVNDDDVKANIRHAVKVLMASEGMSARRLASEIGLTPATLSRRMTGATDWSPGDLARLGQFFEKDPGVFFASPEDFFDRLRALGYNPEVTSDLGERHLTSMPTYGRRKDDGRPVQRPIVKVVDEPANA